MGMLMGGSALMFYAMANRQNHIAEAGEPSDQDK